MLPLGKLKLDFLENILPDSAHDSRVIVGARVGEDAAVIDFGDTCLVAKTDPITFATDAIGWYLVCVNSNDIAAMGAVPKWLLVTILLPEGNATEELVSNIMAQTAQACDYFNIAWCGGHTEVTYGLDRPIVIGQMLGEVPKEKLILSSGARQGDDLILTKGLGIEATSIIARERESELGYNYSDAFLARAKEHLTSPGISVVDDALTAAGTGGVHAMHDPTEGGVATAVHELCRAAQLGALVWEEKLFLSEETERLCREFELNPLGVISSGALLIAAAPASSQEIVDALGEKQIASAIIGRFQAREEGMLLERVDGERQPLPIFENDEITKIFDVTE
ncbi:MAG: AIR synthase family protein [Candidatus Poribacteria bacterium]|nr:AIR synthase family protein [Candidatus Poribacteria bacterium]MDE0506763.1 AIR synthase family protein [Candidatus Poribacteria bacterium]